MILSNRQFRSFLEMSGNDPPLIVIPRVGKRHTLSKQAQKDQGLTTDRMRQNAAYLDVIRTKLEYLCGPSPQKKDLIVVARELCGPCKVSLDRLAKRSRDCLLCWFCEHWSAIEIQFSAMCGQQPRAYDSRNSCGTAKASDDDSQVPAPFEGVDDFDFESIFESCDVSFFGFGEGFGI
jgi:hypothetical protein